MDLEAVTREHKALYEEVTMSDEDIEYLQKTVQRVVRLLNNISPKVSEQQESIDTLIELITPYI